MKVHQGEAPDFLASMAAEKFDQAMGGGDIGPDRVWTASTVMGKVGTPACGNRPRRMPFPL